MFSIPSILLLCALSAPSSGQEGASVGSRLVWQDVEIPANFALHLGTGRVASGGEPGEPLLAYRSGMLSANVSLRALSLGESSPRTRIEREGGELVSGVSAERGRELVFELPDAGWGYLRVLDAAPERVEIEYVRIDGAPRRELRREPPRLDAVSGLEGVELRWSAAIGGEYRIERRYLPRGVAEPRPPWVELARETGPRWRDASVGSTRLAEYRVSLAAVEGGFGRRSRGVGGFASQGELLQVASGAELNLFTGNHDPERIDLTIGVVRPTGVQVQAGVGVQARVLHLDEQRGWMMPEELGSSFVQQQHYLAPGRVLALRLPEGALVRLRVESIRDEVATLVRQINLDGSSIFPPAPELVRSRWDAEEGIVFEFSETELLPGSVEPTLVVESESTLDAGDWTEVQRGAPGERRLVDARPREVLLARYRFRQLLGERQLSPPSESVTVLIGDDGGEGAEDLLRRAIENLGARDYDQRGRARAVILALGSRAWCALREALGSKNPELAAAARELLLFVPPDVEVTEAELDGGTGLAQLLLGVHAEETDAGPPPTLEWIALEPGARASAALRGLGAREVPAMDIANWRRVLAEADPDEGVRLAAALAVVFEREGLGGDQLIRVPEAGSWEEYLGGEECYGLAALELEEVGGSKRPWSELAQLQAWHDLAARRAASAEERAAALERSVLTNFLLAQYERSEDELFLDCALRVIEDPVARMRGALAFADRRRSWEGSATNGDPIDVIHLLEADTGLLFDELLQLRSDPDRVVEIVLPAGVYPAPTTGSSTVVEGARFRLRGEGEVELRFGFTLMRGCDAVFQNLVIAPESGIALNLVRSQVLLVDCTVRGGNLGVQGTEAIVGLRRSAVLSSPSAGTTASGIRFGGRSFLLASESRIESPAVAISGARAALLKRCVVLSEQRYAIEGGGKDEVWAVGCLLRGGNTALYRIERGLLDGVVLLNGNPSHLQIGPGIRMCAEHLRCDGRLTDFVPRVWLENCALGG